MTHLLAKNRGYALFVPWLFSLCCLSCGKVTPTPFPQGLPSSITNLSEGLTVLLVFSWGCGHSAVDDSCDGTSWPGCWAVPKADGLRKNVLISGCAQMQTSGLKMHVQEAACRLHLWFGVTTWEYFLQPGICKAITQLCVRFVVMAAAERPRRWFGGTSTVAESITMFSLYLWWRILTWCTLGSHGAPAWNFPKTWETRIPLLSSHTHLYQEGFKMQQQMQSGVTVGMGRWTITTALFI